MLIFHIIISIVSVTVATLLLARPSYYKLYSSYALILGTIFSGTYLVAVGSVSLVHLCVVGLAYTALVSYFTAVAQSKLAAQEIEE